MKTCAIINPTTPDGYENLISALKSNNATFNVISTRKGNEVIAVFNTQTEEDVANPHWLGSAEIIGFMHPTKKSNCTRQDLLAMIADGNYKLQAAVLPPQKKEDTEQKVVLFLGD